MKSYKRALIAVSLVCSITILILLSVLFYYLNVYRTYSDTLENIYKKNLYEMVTSVNSVEVDISKIVATTSKDTQQKLLNSIYKSCNDIENNLSNLPISAQKTTKVTNLYNMLSGFSYSLIRANAKLTEEDLTSLESMHSSCLIVMYDLNNYLNEVSFNYSILADINLNNEKDSKFTGGFTESNVDDSEVPSLIFDGPFSDSVLNKEIKGLGSVEISKEQALDIINQQFLEYQIKRVEDFGETNGSFATYNFKLYGKDIELYVQITKLGGKVISINSNAKSGKFNFTEDLANELASGFAISLGYEDMYPVWNQKNGNLMYINLAPMVDGIIYYPDLVKVKVDITRAQVVGLDGANYCYNHVARSFSNPTVSTATAKTKVGSRLTITDTNLAVIPNEFVGESYVYEFVCTWKDYQYFVYVDANTGEEVDILRVCSTTYGDLVV